MKKCLILTVLCLVASLFLFGYFNEIQSSGANTVKLGEALDKAEKAIAEANKAMLGWEKEKEKYEVERDALKAQGVTTAATMWNPIDIAKGLFTSSAPWVRLNELYAAIYGCYVQMDAVNGILNQRVVARDAALVAYNNSTSQKRGPINTPEYRTIPECSLPCNNGCGVMFSSSVEGFSGLGAAAAGTHKITCGESGSVSGCGVEHWGCDGKSKVYPKHQVLYCGRNISFFQTSGVTIGSVLGQCGAPYRECTSATGTHRYNGTYSRSSRGPFMSGYQAGSDDRGGLHLWGTPSAPPKSFHGPTPYSNTIGESIDKSPNCSVCLDGSSNCTNASAHASSSGGSTPPSSGGSNPPSSGGSNPPSGGGSNPTPTPTYHACGVHETSVSGDHSLQLSCSSTDSNGNYCTVTNFYACDSHTHSYPAPPPTPTPTPPPPPTTVACGARGWTGCTIRSSDGNACLVDPCDSGCGSYYWSCSTSGVSWHKTPRTCKRANCGASYTNCTRGDGTCSNGAYTWHKQ
ncbi:MAG: hypothetical protein OXU51_00055 [Candidatus Poribacteria bacterium]|nr:hypothetical protein [Candidatus Poribacteria bacterium]